MMLKISSWELQIDYPKWNYEVGIWNFLLVVGFLKYDTSKNLSTCEKINIKSKLYLITGKLSIIFHNYFLYLGWFSKPST